MNKKIVLLIVLLSVAALGGATSLLTLPTASANGPQLVGYMRPFQPATRSSPVVDISWSSLSGKTVSLSDYKGKVVMLNYWATWCGPCMQELPSINRVQASMASDKFTVIAINIDRNGAQTAGPKARELGLKALDLFIDPKTLSARKLGIRGMPSTYLFDTQGRQIGKLEGGAEWDAPESVALINYFIEHPAFADTLPTEEG